MSDFFAALRKKTEITPSPRADRVFWRKFDSEFSAKPRFTLNFNWGFRAPAFAAALLVVVALGVVWKNHSHRQGQLEVAHSLNSDLLSKIEMLKTFDSIPDGLPVSDEDWEILLPEGVS